MVPDEKEFYASYAAAAGQAQATLAVPGEDEKILPNNSSLVRYNESQTILTIVRRSYIVRTLREDQPVRLLLNLLFYHFNDSESTYKSQRIKLS